MLRCHQACSSSAPRLLDCFDSCEEVLNHELLVRNHKFDQDFHLNTSVGILYPSPLGTYANSLVDTEIDETIELFTLFNLFSKNLEISWIKEVSGVSVDLFSATVAKCDAKSCAAIGLNVHGFSLVTLLLYHSRSQLT